MMLILLNSPLLRRQIQYVHLRDVIFQRPALLIPVIDAVGFDCVLRSRSFILHLLEADALLRNI